jgi:hypothetical protein
MQKSLQNPWVDFALLGGGSLFALLAVRLVTGAMNLDARWSLETTLLLANLINHPHFACSYQIFYGDFRNKLFSADYERSLRARYFAIGILAPIAIAATMYMQVQQGRVEALGLCANLMFLLVGWHYVKQGYGMAMLDATLKRAFFNNEEKAVLLRNAYAVWLLAWLLVNFLAKNKAPTYFGIPYIALSVPTWVLTLSAIGAAITTLQCLIMMGRLRNQGRPLAWNGLVAYGVSLYAWLLIRDPIIILWVPLFHSLQYLTVVWRFQVNRCKAAPSQRVNYRYRLVAFFAVSVAVGYYMFWEAPAWLDANITYDKQVFGYSLFFFLFWIFINIHHYLLDTVMWRKGNPEVKRHLFAPPA